MGADKLVDCVVAMIGSEQQDGREHSGCLDIFFSQPALYTAICDSFSRQMILTLILNLSSHVQIQQHLIVALIVRRASMVTLVV